MDNTHTPENTHAPTELQIEKWEDEGGIVPDYKTENERSKNDPLIKKIKLFFKKLLEKISSNVAPRNLQTKASQHHY